MPFFVPYAKSFCFLYHKQPGTSASLAYDCIFMGDKKRFAICVNSGFRAFWHNIHSVMGISPIPLTEKPLQAKPATVLSYYLILSNLIVMLKRVERGQGEGVLKCFPLNV